MFPHIFKPSRVFSFIHVSFYFFSTSQQSSAIVKDAWTVHVLLESIKSGFDFVRGKQVSDKKAVAKYIIFLAAFVFEDIGQVLIQELYQEFQRFLKTSEGSQANELDDLT